VALWRRENTARWLGAAPDAGELELDANARRVRDELEERGASFFRDLADAVGLLPTQVEQALGELVAFGLATADSFSGLRALLLPSDERRALGGARGRGRGASSPFGVDTAGRWSLLRGGDGTGGGGGADREEEVAFHARVLLRRYGVVFRALLDREPLSPPWRELLRVLWRLEARGEVRGGRFVAGFAGEQFALPEAVGALRKARRADPSGELVVVSAADPLNLTGVVTPGGRVPARPSNRVGFRDGVPVCALAEGEVRSLDGEGPVEPSAERALVTRDVPPLLRRYVKTG
jgi:ATP-dependent Lhr-like helicase